MTHALDDLANRVESAIQLRHAQSHLQPVFTLAHEQCLALTFGVDHEGVHIGCAIEAVQRLERFLNARCERDFADQPDAVPNERVCSGSGAGSRGPGASQERTEPPPRGATKPWLESASARTPLRVFNQRS